MPFFFASAATRRSRTTAPEATCLRSQSDVASSMLTSQGFKQTCEFARHARLRDDLLNLLVFVVRKLRVEGRLAVRIDHDVRGLCHRVGDRLVGQVRDFERHGLRLRNGLLGLGRQLGDPRIGEVHRAQADRTARRRASRSSTARLPCWKSCRSRPSPSCRGRATWSAFPRACRCRGSGRRSPRPPPAR